MNWIQEHRVSFFFVAVTLLVPLILYANVLFGVLGLGFEYADERERIRSQVSRLKNPLCQPSINLRLFIIDANSHFLEVVEVCCTGRSSQTTMCVAQHLSPDPSSAQNIPPRTKTAVSLRPSLKSETRSNLLLEFSV